MIIFFKVMISGNKRGRSFGAFSLLQQSCIPPDLLISGYSYIALAPSPMVYAYKKLKNGDGQRKDKDIFQNYPSCVWERGHM